MSLLKLAFGILAVSALAAHAKPSLSYGVPGLHGFESLPPFADQFELAPPVLPPAHFHAAAPPPLPEPAQFLPAHFPYPLLPPPAPLVPAPHAAFAPTPVIPAPVLHTHFLPAPAPAPLPLLPAPLPLTRVLPPVYEAVPFAAPTYRAIPGPKTTTHHISVGYAFPQPAFAKLVAAPHAHLHAAPFTFGHHHHHHSSLF